ncbi:hypothetical protein L7F22_040473 [Adiantum nelumboides]|nr:hypothetical protein [Adiantum nelumboides]
MLECLLLKQAIYKDEETFSLASSTANQARHIMAQERQICTLEKELNVAIASVGLARAEKRLAKIAQRFAVAILLFTLTQQARAWELDCRVPSVLESMEYNLKVPFPFVWLSMIPLVVYTFLELVNMETTSSFPSFLLVSVACYGFATGAVALLAMVTQIIMYAAASMQIFVKLRCKVWIQRANTRIPTWVSSQMNALSSSWVIEGVHQEYDFFLLI